MAGGIWVCPLLWRLFVIGCCFFLFCWTLLILVCLFFFFFLCKPCPGADGQHRCSSSKIHTIRGTRPSKGHPPQKKSLIEIVDCWHRPCKHAQPDTARLGACPLTVRECVGLGLISVCLHCKRVGEEPKIEMRCLWLSPHDHRQVNNGTLEFSWWWWWFVSSTMMDDFSGIHRWRNSADIFFFYPERNGAIMDSVNTRWRVANTLEITQMVWWYVCPSSFVLFWQHLVDVCFRAKERHRCHAAGRRHNFPNFLARLPTS